jgi:hypothetical protein
MASSKEVEQEWIAHMRDVSDLDACPVSVFRCFFKLFSTKYNWITAIDKVAKWIIEFKGGQGAERALRNNLIGVLKSEYVEFRDWKEEPCIRKGKRGPKRDSYLLSTDTAKKLLMRFSPLVRTYYITIEKLYQAWMRNGIKRDGIPRKIAGGRCRENREPENQRRGKIKTLSLRSP